MAKPVKNVRVGNEVKGATPAPAAPVAAAAPARTTTPVRNSPVPKPVGNAGNGRKEITHEMIAKRAYEISISGQGGSELDNWFRAERELRGI